MWSNSFQLRYAPGDVINVGSRPEIGQFNPSPTLQHQDVLSCRRKTKKKSISARRWFQLKLTFDVEVKDAEGVEMEDSLQDLVEVEEALVQGQGLCLSLVTLQHAGQTPV